MVEISFVPMYQQREKAEKHKSILHRSVVWHMEICQYAKQTWRSGTEDHCIKNVRFLLK